MKMMKRVNSATSITSNSEKVKRFVEDKLALLESQLEEQAEDEHTYLNRYLDKSSASDSDRAQAYANMEDAMNECAEAIIAYLSVL